MLLKEFVLANRRQEIFGQASGEVTPLSELVNEVVCDLGISEKIVECEAVLVWNDVVGFSLAKNARPIRVKNGILEVAVPSAVWRTQLNFMATDIVNRINIHVGASYGNRETALSRFCKNFEGLSESVRSRLTVENDDKGNLYSTKMLYEGVYQRVGVPIVLDSHHFECGPQDVDYEESLLMAMDSWPEGITPQCHHSNSRKEYENPDVVKSAHSDYYYKPFKNCGHTIDVVLEAKAKEKALFDYMKKFNI